MAFKNQRVWWTREKQAQPRNSVVLRVKERRRWRNEWSRSSGILSPFEFQEMHCNNMVEIRSLHQHSLHDFKSHLRHCLEVGMEMFESIQYFMRASRRGVEPSEQRKMSFGGGYFFLMKQQ